MPCLITDTYMMLVLYFQDHEFSFQASFHLDAPSPFFGAPTKPLFFIVPTLRLRQGLFKPPQRYFLCFQWAFEVGCFNYIENYLLGSIVGYFSWLSFDRPPLDMTTQVTTLLCSLSLSLSLVRTMIDLYLGTS